MIFGVGNFEEQEWLCSSKNPGMLEQTCFDSSKRCSLSLMLEQENSFARACCSSMTSACSGKAWINQFKSPQLRCCSSMLLEHDLYHARASSLWIWCICISIAVARASSQSLLEQASMIQLKLLVTHWCSGTFFPLLEHSAWASLHLCSSKIL